MTSPFHAVARGLRLAHVGYLLACWGAASALGVGWLLSNTHYRDDERWAVLIVALWMAILTGVGGVIVGFVGRVRCLRMPEEFPAVRGRAIAAIALEGSGWLSLFVGIGVMFAMAYRWLPPAEWVPAIGMLVSVLMLLGGRIMFLRCLRFLARVVEDKQSFRRAGESLAVFLIDWAAGLIGFGIAAAGGVLGMYETTLASAYVVWIAVGASGLAGLLLYDRLLGGLAKSVQTFADTPVEDDEADETE